MASIAIPIVTKRFGEVVAVDSLSFDVEQGTTTGFLGPNGAAKTTTLRMQLGLGAPTSGTATIDGKVYRDLEVPLQHVGAALESDPSLQPVLARFAARIRKFSGRVDRAAAERIPGNAAKAVADLEVSNGP